jgi:type I restriction enzyme S subunit
MRELVRLIEPDVVVSPEETYHFAGVYSFGRGVFKGQLLSGTQFSYKSLTRLRTGNLVYPKLMAWEGGIGIVPPECNGLVVSPEFPVFEVNESLVLPEILDVYFRIPSVWSLLANFSTGTNIRRRRLHPSSFLKFEIPLPPIEEQRRIVTRVEELRRKIEEARSLRQKALEETEALMLTSRVRIFEEASKQGTIRFDEVATLERGKFSHRPRNDPRFFEGTHPWIQIAEIESSGKYIQHWTQTLNDDGLAISRKFPKGTLLISIAATIGAVGILNFDCCIPDSIVAINPNQVLIVNISTIIFVTFAVILRGLLHRTHRKILT